MQLHYKVVGTVWVALLLRGLFDCVEQPIWEGFDEWAPWRIFSTSPNITRSLPERITCQAELQRSLELVPLSRPAAQVVPGAVTHEAFWHLPAQERIGRRNELPRLSSQHHLNDANLIARQYEEQQPPLYYVIL